MPDADLGAHHLARKGLDDVGRDPGGAGPRGDVGRADVLRLDSAQRDHVPLVLRIERGGRFGDGEPGPHGARQVGVGRLPLCGLRVAEDGRAEFGQRGVRVALQQVGQVIEIDAPGLVQGDGERVGGGRDQWCDRRRDDPFGEDRPFAGEARLDVVAFDAGDQPAVRIVGEMREIGSPMRFPLFAGLRVGDRGDHGVVDRAEVADEGRIGDAETDLRLCPGAIGGLGAQHVADGIADRQEGADHLGGAGGDPLPALALPGGHHDGPAIHDLAEAPTLCR